MDQAAVAAVFLRVGEISRLRKLIHIILLDYCGVVMGGAMQARARGYSVVTAVVGGSLVFASAIAGLFLFTRSNGPDVASDRHQAGTIQLAPQGSLCKRLVIDNSTGTIKPGQSLPCGEASKEAVKSSADNATRYSSGGRVGAIQESFKNR